uniref:Uncharacterized protein n=1 Tax=Rhizophora mucronata TaxID=61149 RepID=A0A2P2J369_RHIMU
MDTLVYDQIMGGRF